MDLRKAFPEKFPFYHLGVVEQDQSSAEGSVAALSLTHDQKTLAYRLHGDWNGVLIIAFATDLDSSTYSEVGNIVASQIATRLSKAEGLDIMVLPPQTLSPTQLSWMIQHSGEPLLTRYRHVVGEKSFIVDSLLLQSFNTGENGNA